MSALIIFQYFVVHVVLLVKINVENMMLCVYDIRRQKTAAIVWGVYVYGFQCVQFHTCFVVCIH